MKQIIKHKRDKKLQPAGGNQLAVYKRGRGAELGATEKQIQPVIQPVVGAGLDLGAFGFRVQRANHSATLPSV